MRARLDGLIGKASIRFAVTAVLCAAGVSCVMAAELPVKGGQTPPPYGTVPWGGLSWGLGIAADFDVTGARVTDAAIINNVVRVKDSTSNVGVGFILEAHYFLTDYQVNLSPGYVKCNFVAKTVGDMINYNCNNIGFGPFIAVEVGNGTSSSPDPKSLVTAVGLGAMVGLHHPWATNNSSWNLGVGLRIDPNTTVLGDGFVANQAPPAGETSIRLKHEPRLGIMLVSSFSF